jgi:NADH-quinone oxidoreductase subunit G
VVNDVPPGVVLAPADLPGVELAAVQTGPRTRVHLVKLVV